MCLRNKTLCQFSLIVSFYVKYQSQDSKVSHTYFVKSRTLAWCKSNHLHSNIVSNRTNFYLWHFNFWSISKNLQVVNIDLLRQWIKTQLNIAPVSGIQSWYHLLQLVWYYLWFLVSILNKMKYFTFNNDEMSMRNQKSWYEILLIQIEWWNIIIANLIKFKLFVVSHTSAL